MATLRKGYDLYYMWRQVDSAKAPPVLHQASDGGVSRLASGEA